MVSNRILWAAIAASVLWPVFDMVFHSHFRCGKILENVEEQLAIRTHLYDYMKDHTDFAGQPEEGKVVCECADRKVTLKGRVLSESIKKEFSDVASYAVGGPDRLDNQLEVLNDPGIRELQGLLAEPPNNMAVNYQIKDRGTVHLTGDLPPNAAGLKAQISRLVAKMGGVRSVVNDLGKHIEVQRTLVVRNIYFDFNKWKVREQSQESIDLVVEKLTQYFDGNATGVVRVEGHTDSISSEKYNQWLSEKRAKAVVEALVASGIDRNRLKPIGRGESQLLMKPDDTPEKRAENRRIEFHFE